MFICEPCFAQGMRDPCVHNRDSVPDHLGENSELVKSMYGDNDESRARDVMGIVDDVGCNCFTEHSVMNMMKSPRETIYKPVRFIFVVVDPCAGSRIEETRASDFCIVTMCAPFSTIVGIDAFDVITTQDYEPRVLEHIRRIRAMPMFTNATIVLDAESGTGLTAGDVQLLIQLIWEKYVY